MEHVCVVYVGNLGEGKGGNNVDMLYADRLSWEGAKGVYFWKRGFL